jgi:DNA-binding CsgD family transcriptional regulator
MKRYAIYTSGVLWAIGYVIHAAGPNGFANQDVDRWANLSEVFFLVAILIGYLVAMLFRRASLRTLIRATDVSCVLMVLNGVILLATTIVQFESLFLISLGNIVVGFGIGISSVIWGLSLSKRNMDDLEKAMLSWFPAAAIVFALIFGFTIGGFSVNILLGVLATLLPVISQIGLRISLQDYSGSNSLLDYSREQANTHLPWPVFLRMMTYLLLVFTALSFIWTAYSALRNIGSGLSMAYFAIGAIALFGLSWFTLRRTRHFGLQTLFRWALPIAILALATGITNDGAILPISYILLILVYLGFDATVKLFLLYVAQKHAAHAMQIVGLGLAMINIGGMLGIVCWNSFSPALETLGFTGIMLFALFPFVTAIALLLDQDFLQLKRVNISFATTSAKELGGPQMLPPPSKNEDLDQNITHRCAVLAGRFGLTAREQEVLEILARGRSRAYIREALYVSKSTVDSHISHIYTKMGINSRNTLMSLILDKDTEKCGPQPG